MAVTAAALAVSITARTDKFHRKMKAVNRRLDKVRKAAVRKITLGITAAAAGAAFAMTKAVRSAENFNRAMNRSLAIMGDLSDTMRQRLQKAAIETARVTKFSTKEVAEAYFFLASAGFDAEQSIAALPKVAEFAQAGMFGLAKATELLGGAQSSLGLKVEDVAQNMRNMQRVSDVLVKANVLGQASVEEFGIALARSGGSLRLMGKGLEEGAAILAVFAKSMLKAERGASALDIVLRELSSKALENDAIFKKHKIVVFALGGKMRKVADIIADVERRFEGMGDKQRKLILMELGFTAESLKMIGALIGMSDQIARYELQLRSAAGVTEAVAKKQLTGMEKAIARLEATWTQLGLAMAPITEVFVITINAVAAALKSLADRPDLFTAMADGIKKAGIWALTLTTWVDGLSAAWEGVKAMIQSVAAIGVSFLETFVRGLRIIGGFIGLNTKSMEEFERTLGFLKEDLLKTAAESAAEGILSLERFKAAQTPKEIIAAIEATMAEQKPAGAAPLSPIPFAPAPIPLAAAVGPQLPSARGGDQGASEQRERLIDSMERLNQALGT